MKPTVDLIGSDGNVFLLMSKCKNALIREGMVSEANEMMEEVLNSHSYVDALAIMSRYVEVE